MTGILLLTVIGLWLWACTAITRALMYSLPLKWRSVIGLFIWMTLLVLPVADEIVGGFQFRALCEKNAVFRIGVTNPEGRVTRFSASPDHAILAWTAITIYHTGVRFIDVKSGEHVVEFDEYVAKGGWFIRTLGISENNAPITMNSGSCSPQQIRGESVHRTLGFSVVN